MGIPRVHLLAAGLASFMALKFRFFGDSNGESTSDHASGAKLDGHALAFLVHFLGASQASVAHGVGFQPA